MYLSIQINCKVSHAMYRLRMHALSKHAVSSPNCSDGRCLPKTPLCSADCWQCPLEHYITVLMSQQCVPIENTSFLSSWHNQKSYSHLCPQAHFAVEFPLTSKANLGHNHFHRKQRRKKKVLVERRKILEILTGQKCAVALQNKHIVSFKCPGDVLLLDTTMLHFAQGAGILANVQEMLKQLMWSLGTYLINLNTFNYFPIC